eukprot:5713876-Amphidinium_carterae.1
MTYILQGRQGDVKTDLLEFFPNSMVVFCLKRVLRFELKATTFTIDEFLFAICSNLGACGCAGTNMTRLRTCPSGHRTWLSTARKSTCNNIGQRLCKLGKNLVDEDEELVPGNTSG